jgi:hypothetical protein
MGTITLPSALTLHLIVTFGLVVLIWIIQVLHYPSFGFYEEQNFSQAMHFHQQRITLITLPLMVSEIILAVYVLNQSQNIYTNSSLILVGLIWLSTFFIQVPLHEKLLKSKEPILIAKLVKTNWIRTFLWSFKLMILGWEFYL